jgi:uncharacterized Tic20 family protein
VGSPAPFVRYANEEEKAWALVSHFGGAVAFFLPALVVLLVKGNESRTVRAHAVNALNFQIPWSGIMIVAQVLAICTGGGLFFLPLGCWAIAAAFSIMAGIRANDGRLYRYPLGLPLLN